MVHTYKTAASSVRAGNSTSLSLYLLRLVAALLLLLLACLPLVFQASVMASLLLYPGLVIAGLMVLDLAEQRLLQRGRKRKLIKRNRPLNQLPKLDKRALVCCG